MAKDTNNLAVRFILRSEADKIAFEELQNNLILDGKEFAEWFSEKVDNTNSFYRFGNVDKPKNIVDSEYLQKYVRETFGKELSKGGLQYWRNNVWSLGKEYYSAPKGNSFEIRYDFDECLPELKKFGEK